jgi:hypothetical protein
MYRVKWLHVSLVFLLALVLAIPAMAQTSYDSELPGSVIVFPKFITGTTDGEPNSQFEISVGCPLGVRNSFTGACPGFPEGTRVKLKAHWVCPGDQTFENKYICRETDFDLFTTVFGTISFNPENVGAAANFPATPLVPTGGGTQRVPNPPCDRGYLIAWVVNTQDVPINFNALIGDAIIRDANGSVSAYNGIPIQAAPVAAAATNTPITVGPTGELPFTGADGQYAMVSNTIQSSVRFEAGLQPGPAVTTDLTLLTLDVLSNRSNSPVFVDLNFYNANEFLVSTFHEFICWTEVSLSGVNLPEDSELPFISSNLTAASMGTQKGLVVSGQAVKVPFVALPTDTPGPVTLLGIVTTSVFDGTSYAYSYSLYHEQSFSQTQFQPTFNFPPPPPPPPAPPAP